MCQKVKIVLFTRPQVHKRGDSYVYDGIKICQPFNIWRPKMQHLFVFFMNPSPTVLDNLKSGLIFWFYDKYFFLQKTVFGLFFV